MYCMLINLTPHTIQLHTDLGVATIPSDGDARSVEEVAETVTLRWDQFGDCGMSQDVPLAHKHYGSVTGLPAPRKDCLYIVSTLVQQACPEREDLVSPDQVIRDTAGRVVGCRGFYRLDSAPTLEHGWEDRAVERAKREGVLG